MKDSVYEATEVLNETFNTQRCFLESGLEFRRPRSASLGDAPKKLTKGEEWVTPPPPESKISSEARHKEKPT